MTNIVSIDSAREAKHGEVAARTSRELGDVYDALLTEKIWLDREICERSLHEFIRHFWSEMDPSLYVDGWHIGAICEHLEAVTNGDIKRLIINIPPRHMKSLATSVAWFAWMWAQEPSEHRFLAGPQVRFLSTSYAHTLSVRDSRRARMLIQSLKYKRYWGDRVRLAGDQNAKARFENTAQGYRLATSVDGTATGEGGDVILIDDPLNAKEKESEATRHGVIDYWTQVLPTRLNDPKRGAFVVIMQRLHHQDLTGHILEYETGWTHLVLPARYEHDHPHVWSADPRNEDGDLLWPEQYPEQQIGALEEQLGSFGASGQLQQRPAPREGGMFKHEWFKIVEAAPAQGRKVRAWDLAGSRGKASPYTAGVLFQRTGNEYYVLDVIRNRGTPKDMHETMINVASQDGPGVLIDFPQDPGQAGKDQKRIIMGELSGYNVRSNTETGAKETRAEPYSAQVEAGNVYILRGKWNKDYIDELTVFPNSDFSDQVDASSRAFSRLTKRKALLGGGAIILGG